ncbi:MAG: PQQ-binding-like beta-propeller repeat protein [Rhodothermaceae bacterium]
MLLRKITLILVCLIISISANEKVLWKFETGGKVYATPLVSENVVYVGSLDSNFYAVDKLSGKKIWQFNSGNPIHSTAIIHKDILIFESGNNLFFLNLKGELIRKMKLGKASKKSQIDSWDFFHSSPVIYNDKIYIGTSDGKVVGIDFFTGEKIVEIETGEPIRATPIVTDNKIFFGDWEGVFYSHNNITGEEFWKYDTKNDSTFIWKNSIHEKPLLVNDKIYMAGRSCRVYCLDKNSGQKIWSHKSSRSGWLLGGPAYSDGKIFLGSSNEAIVQCFTAETGELLWETKLDHRIWGIPLAVKNDLIIGSGSLYKLDKTSGEIKEVLIDRKTIEIPITKIDHPKWKGEEYQSSFHSSPVYSKGVVYIGCDDGNLYAVEVN